MASSFRSAGLVSGLLASGIGRGCRSPSVRARIVIDVVHVIPVLPAMRALMSGYFP